MTQEYLRELHRSGGLIEITFDSPMEQAPVLEPLPVVKTRAGRSPGGQDARTKKKNQRARNAWRQEVWALTADQELVASVVDRDSYIGALQAVKRREERRANFEADFPIRLSSGWQSLPVTGPRIIAQCVREDMERGLYSRKKTPGKPRLSENRGGDSTETIRLIDDQTSELVFAHPRARRDFGDTYNFLSRRLTSARRRQVATTLLIGTPHGALSMRR